MTGQDVMFVERRAVKMTAWFVFLTLVAAPCGGDEFRFPSKVIC